MQRAMQILLLGISHSEKVTNEEIRRRTGVKDIIERVSKITLATQATNPRTREWTEMAREEEEEQKYTPS